MTTGNIYQRHLSRVKVVSKTFMKYSCKVWVPNGTVTNEVFTRDQLKEMKLICKT